ncbi:MAG TPA: hypothetical protein VFY10_06365, partial [Dehalococcoidia bacterium]|nr:hypothetical protein [Dehalococcoidia bacterium]
RPVYVFSLAAVMRFIAKKGLSVPSYRLQAPGCKQIGDGGSRKVGPDRLTAFSLQLEAFLLRFRCAESASNIVGMS